MGSIHVMKYGKTYVVDEDATGAQVKRLLELPSDSILVNARNEQIGDFEPIGNKVREGEAIASKPQFKYWREQ
ncbi:MAG: hypothetical protein ACUVTD_02480 [Nitrososphaerales archaeon]